MSQNFNARPAVASMAALIANSARVTPPSVIVFGPKGCGKTFHAEALADYYGCAAIIDDWHRPKSGMIPANTLLLTTHRPQGSFSNPVEIVSFSDALTAIHNHIAEGI